MSLEQFEAILAESDKYGASDIHLSDGCYPTLRVSGSIQEQNELALLSGTAIRQMIESIVNERDLQTLDKERNLDIAYTSKGHMRYRINIYFERGCPAMAIRWLDGRFHSLAELRLPPQLMKLSGLRDGLVLITGATGSGKSTTLASIINEINCNRPCHILTIEDPVEFLHKNQKAIVHQREVGKDVNSFSDAIRAAMREDPDVILLGEMRDNATMSAALMAAETGHLVFSTLHTNDAVGVIDRLVGSFPGEEQSGVRQQLSMVLRAVVTQTLVRPDNKPGRVPVNEILLVNGAVSNLIRTHKPEQIYSIMETGRSLGNQTFDYALASRVKEQLIPREQAKRLARKPNSFDTLLSRLVNGAQND